MRKKNKPIKLKKWRFYLFFSFYTFLLLFYAGNNYYFNIFAYNRPLFLKNEKKNLSIKKNDLPYVINPNLPLNVFAPGIYVVELSSFTPVYKRNIKKKFYPASLTKIITALTALDVYQPEDIIIIEKPVSEGRIMGLVEGERITVENLLYGILIHSANDAAYALANHYGKEKFVNMMNEKVKGLSMTNSHFNDPAGFDNLDHYTTPFDIALAARALLRSPYLKKIVSIKEITISDVDFKYFHPLINVNQLLGEISGLGGIKTGFTEYAGENLISFYKKNNHQWLIIVLKSNDRFSETKEIISWINNNVGFAKID